jgi:hypothetical protein
VKIYKQNQQETKQKTAAAEDKVATVVDDKGDVKGNAVDKEKTAAAEDKVATVVDDKGDVKGNAVDKEKKHKKKHKKEKKHKMRGKGRGAVDKDKDKEKNKGRGVEDKDKDKEKNKGKGKKRQAENSQAQLERLAKLRKEEDKRTFNCAERKAKVDRKQAEADRERAIYEQELSQLARTTQARVDVQSELGDAAPPAQPDPRATFKRAHAIDAEEHVMAQRVAARNKILGDSRLVLKEDAKDSPPTSDSNLVETFLAVLDRKGKYGLRTDMELMGFVHDQYRKVGEKIVWGWKWQGKWLCLA